MQVLSLLAKGRSLISAGHFSEAKAVLGQSMEIEGETALGWHYMASALAQDPNELAASISAQRRAALLATDNAVFRSAYGLRLLQIEQDKPALCELEAALALDPSNPVVLHWVLRLRRRILMWQDAAQEADLLNWIKQAQCVLDPLVSLTVCDDPSFQLQQAASAAANIAALRLDLPVKGSAGADVVEGQSADQKIRIGYVSADFYTHATMLLIAGLLRHHDKSRFEVYIYDLDPRPACAEHRAVRESADTYVDASVLNNVDLATRMRRDALDIAVDLKGYTTNARMAIFRARVAPVQVSYLGFPGTTGLAEMDYMLADPVTIPVEAQPFYSEKILYMPACYQPNDNARPLPEVQGTRADHGLPEEAVVLASFNHPHKILPAQFDLWMQAMRALPETVLWFYSGGHDISARLGALAEARGVAAERMIVSDRVWQGAHMGRMGHADICLDSTCYNAHTTASDAVWAGVPMVTMIGQQFAARVAASILTTAGIPEMVAEDEAGYLRILTRLVTEPDWRQEVRQRLCRGRENSPLFDTESYTKHYEDLLEKAHRHRLSGAPPVHLSL